MPLHPGPIKQHLQVSQKQAKDGVAYIDHYPADQRTFYYDIWNNRHRIDGPAISRKTDLGEHQEWYLHGKRHRDDGPAIEYADGEKHWFYNDYPIDCSSQEEFERILKLKAFW
jgi:hypothetical protein